tara:strand:+ start:4840 stop:5022 length:183 start_codon:yes stop_codon:yes gene_type:complete
MNNNIAVFRSKHHNLHLAEKMIDFKRNRTIREHIRLERDFQESEQTRLEREELRGEHDTA